MPVSLSAPLNLRQIEAFHAIMITGSLSGAGKMLYVTQPAVSRILASAESRLKFPLFERNKGRLTPTPEALRLFAEAQLIFDGVSRFNSLAAGLNAGMGGSLDIVSSPSLSEWLFPRTIQRYREEDPETYIRYHSLGIDLLVQQVLLGQADFGIASTAAPNDASVECEEIGQGWLACAIPAGHPLATRPFVRLEDLQGHLLISCEPDTPFGRLASRFLDSKGGVMKPDIAIRATHEALALVRQGVGVALIGSFGFRADQQTDFILRPTQPLLLHKIYLIRSSKRPLSVAARRFLVALRQGVREQSPAWSPLD